MRAVMAAARLASRVADFTFCSRSDVSVIDSTTSAEAVTAYARTRVLSKSRIRFPSLSRRLRRTYFATSINRASETDSGAKAFCTAPLIPGDKSLVTTFSSHPMHSSLTSSAVTPRSLWTICAAVIPTSAISEPSSMRAFRTISSARMVIAFSSNVEWSTRCLFRFCAINPRSRKNFISCRDGCHSSPPTSLMPVLNVDIVITLSLGGT